VPSRDVRFLCVHIPRDIWNDLELYTYVLRLEGRSTTKGEVVAQALRKLFDDPELQKLLKRAKEIYHIEDGEA